MKIKHITLVSFLLAALILAACQEAQPTTIPVGKTTIAAEIVAGEPPAQELTIDASPEESLLATVEAEASYPMPYASQPPLPASGGGGAPGQPYPPPYTSGVGGGGQTIPAASRMVIKDAALELLVSDTDMSVDQVTQMATDYGGYIVSSQTWYSGDYKYASLRLAVPSDSFEAALNFLRHIGVRLISETASGQDVSAEYVDLQSRLDNLQATAARVRQFLDEAENVEEALLVNAELSQLEAQIEQIEGQMSYYETRTTYSTVTVNLTPEQPTPTPTPTPTQTPPPTPTPGWNPGETVQDASQTLVKMSQGTVDFLIRIAVIGGPPLILLGLLLWAGKTAFRRMKK
jgi:hypothetical protein